MTTHPILLTTSSTKVSLFDAFQVRCCRYLRENQNLNLLVDVAGQYKQSRSDMFMQQETFEMTGNKVCMQRSSDEERPERRNNIEYDQNFLERRSMITHKALSSKRCRTFISVQQGQPTPEDPCTSHGVPINKRSRILSIADTISPINNTNPIHLGSCVGIFTQASSEGGICKTFDFLFLSRNTGLPVFRFPDIHDKNGAEL